MPRSGALDRIHAPDQAKTFPRHTFDRVRVPCSWILTPMVHKSSIFLRPTTPTKGSGERGITHHLTPGVRALLCHASPGAARGGLRTTGRPWQLPAHRPRPCSQAAPPAPFAASRTTLCRERFGSVLSHETLRCGKCTDMSIAPTEPLTGRRISSYSSGSASCLLGRLSGASGSLRVASNISLRFGRMSMERRCRSRCGKGISMLASLSASQMR